MSDNNDDGKFDIYVNNIRTELLKLSDNEMLNKIRNPFTKINSEVPKMVNFCKENNFYMVIKENFCSSRVSFTEHSLTNVKINNEFKRHHKQQSTFGILSSKFVNRIPNAPNTHLSFTNFNNIKWNSKGRFDFPSNKMKSMKKFPNISLVPSNKNLIQIKHQIENKNLPQKQLSPGESPSIRRLKGMTKKGITKKSIFKETFGENLTSRNNCGAYLDDPLVFLRIKESFVYIRSLPFIKKSNLKLLPSEREIKEQEEFEELEGTLLIKDNIDEKEAFSKLNKIKEQTQGIKGAKTNNTLLNSIHHQCMKNRLLSPINKFNKPSSKGSNLFLLDLRSAHDTQFKLDLEGLDSYENNGLLTDVNRRGNDNSDLDLNSSGSVTEDENNFESSMIKKHGLDDKVVTIEDVFDIALNKTIC